MTTAKEDDMTLPYRKRGEALERAMAEHPAPPGPAELWDQAGGDAGTFRVLMREHGYLLSPGDEGYEDAPASPLCGWPGRTVKESTGGGEAP